MYVVHIYLYLFIFSLYVFIAIYLSFIPLAKEFFFVDSRKFNKIYVICVFYYVYILFVCVRSLIVCVYIFVCVLFHYYLHSRKSTIDLKKRKNLRLVFLSCVVYLTIFIVVLTTFSYSY